MLKPIQGLWVGERLSAMERLSIRSFLAQGHPYHLYTYGPVEGVPEGTQIHAAGRILPRERIFKVQNSFAPFSDFFRWKLLFERGGWWVDLDVVALKPFETASPYLFASQRQGTEGSPEIPTSGIAYAGAPGSECFGWMSAECQAKNPNLLRWTEVGPDLIGLAVDRFNLWAYVVRAALFSPVPWFKTIDLVRPSPARPFNGSLAVHLWSSMWSRANRDRNAAYPGSIYARLQELYPEHIQRDHSDARPADARAPARLDRHAAL
jgi:hypothetical protein